ncbi:hypothetical protein RUND412_005225 [Rhizina undulata]
MEAVPTEILREILSYIPQQDLSSVRLVSHFFENGANERFFRTIRVPVTQEAIAKLQHISQRPELAQRVRHLIYPYQRLNPIDDLSDIDDSESVAYNSEDDVEPMPTCGRSYKKQKALEDSGEFAKELEFALSKMLNVTEITTNWNGDPCDRRSMDWPENVITDIGNFHGLRNHCSIVSDMLPDSMTAEREERLLREFKHLMTAAYQARTRLNKLSAYSIWRGILADNSETSIWNILPLFQNLTSLSVFFCTAGTGEDFKALQEDLNEGRLFRFLSAAPKLRKLALGLEWRPYDLEIQEEQHLVIPFNKILGDGYVWKNLETFLFNGSPLNAEELTYFLTRHESTLKTFGLYRPHLRTGTWRDVCDSIKERPGLKLQRLTIVEASEQLENGDRRCYFHDYDGFRMHHYVVLGGPAFPFTQAELEQRGLQGHYNGFSEDSEDDDLYLFEDEYDNPWSYDGPYAYGALWFEDEFESDSWDSLDEEDDEDEEDEEPEEEKNEKHEE